MQVHGIDCTETFALAIRQKLLKILLAIATTLKMTLLQRNVIGASLKTYLGQNKYLIYMEILQGCGSGQKRLVCKIMNSLYSFKEA